MLKLSPQTRVPAFGVAPLSPCIPIFWIGKKKAAGGGQAFGARAGCRPGTGAGAGPAPGRCCGDPAVLSGSVGRWLIAPVNHRAAPRSAVYFSDSNLVLALFHTCHRVFFLTLEACRKRTVINGAIHPGGGSFITL